MSKTITIRLDEPVYELFKKAAEGQKRTISNYIEYATLNFTVNEGVVDDAEMNEILVFEAEIRKGLSDVTAGRYQIVE